MIVKGATKKLEKTLSSERSLIKTFGSINGKKVAQRVSELRAAETLNQISHLPPPRLHELHGDWQGFFSVTLTGNWRLVFQGYDKEENKTMDKDQIILVVIKPR
ncbi:type II toxin-antitoxin system RelE/ParE family toxin [Schleiferilactobacillus shenzhenensis]|uniref:type II toxin-antitoxin system RelE/ParE family toxin n=1 Tax=Schleiferilactobacillus shenzhenensis TaxID=1231337 RepID=UPI00058CCE95|nr:type II toxin-antitoxin system RelE/ParE family toxin [Schleiferilactobacillus shenzhenensis]